MTKKTFKKSDDISTEKNSIFNLPLVNAKHGDNGIMYFGKESDFSSAEMTIDIVGDGAIATGDVYPQPQSTGVLYNAYLVKYSDSKHEIKENHLFYFACAMQKSIKLKYGYDNKAGWEKVRNELIALPTNKLHKIDFTYMENYIQKIINDNLLIMNDFIKSNNLKNSILSSAEKKAIEDFENGKTKFFEFKIGDLFEAQTGDVDLQQKDCNGKGHFLINSGLDNIGIKGRTDRKAKVFSANTITIDFWGNAYYRDFEYKMATHNHVFSLSGDCIKNENVGLYLVSRLSYMKNVFSYSSMGTWTRIKEMGISLPVNDTNEIDYAFMENYISAQKKLAILPIVSSGGRENKTEYQINSSYGTRNVAEK